MATPVLNVCPYALDICVTRRDSTPMTFTMQDGLGAPLTITGRTYIFTVNSDEEPSDTTNELFNIVGAVSTPDVTFTPLAGDFNIVPETYFYDIQETNGTAVRTVAKGKFTVGPQITQ